MPKYHLAIQSFLVHQGIFLLLQLPKNKREKRKKKKKEGTLAKVDRNH